MKPYHLKQYLYIWTKKKNISTVESAFKSLICPRRKTTYNRKRLVSKFNLFQPSLTFFRESLWIWFSDLAILCRVVEQLYSHSWFCLFCLHFLDNPRFKVCLQLSAVFVFRMASQTLCQWTVTELWLTDCDKKNSLPLPLVVITDL